MCQLPTTAPTTPATPLDGVLADLQHAVESAHPEAQHGLTRIRCGDYTEARRALERVVAALDAVRP